jgi:hypothetical protein
VFKACCWCGEEFCLAKEVFQCVSVWRFSRPGSLYDTIRIQICYKYAERTSGSLMEEGIF